MMRFSLRMSSFRFSISVSRESSWDCCASTSAFNASGSSASLSKEDGGHRTLMPNANFSFLMTHTLPSERKSAHLSGRRSPFGSLQTLNSFQSFVDIAPGYSLNAAASNTVLSAWKRPALCCRGY